MTALVESPWPWIAFGIFAEVALGLLLLHTQRGALLLPMGGVLLVVLGGLVLERHVVTDRERVEQCLEGVAAALEANDVQRVLEFISPSAVETRRQARRALDYAEFQQIKIKDLQITVNYLTSPPSARAMFTAWVTASDRANLFGVRTVPLEFRIDFRQEGQAWLITGHEARDAPAGLSRSP